MTPRGDLTGKGEGVLGLRAFNIVLAGTGFPVSRIDVSDFDFHGRKPKVELQIPQILQASAGEYAINVLGERFQVSANANKATQHRIDALKQVAHTFVAEYASRKSITAIGHNFQGDFKPRFDSSMEFMKHLAWKDSLAAALGNPSEPVLSLTTRFSRGDSMVALLRLEPLTGDRSKILYDLNFSWGSQTEPLPAPAEELLDRYPESVNEAAAIVEALAALDA